MRKTKLLFVILISFFAFNMNALAAPNVSLSVDKNNIHVGDTFIVKIDLKSIASWNINLTSNGSVKGCSLDEDEKVNDSGNGLNMDKSFSKTCTANGTGKIVISLSGDVTSVNESNPIDLNNEEVSQSVTINVNKSMSVKSKDSKTMKNNVVNNPMTSASFWVALIIVILLSVMTLTRYRLNKQKQ